MTKLEFIKELESLLPDIPSEEREEALRYYNGYFDDAGEENEDEIIKELGSPERVAKIIKAELLSNEEERENRGYFTERGYQDTVYDDEKLEIVKTANKDTQQADKQNAHPGSQNVQGDNGQWNTVNASGAAYSGNAGYANRGSNGGNYGNASNTGNTFNGGNAYNAGQAGNSSYVNNASNYTQYNNNQGRNGTQGYGQSNAQGNAQRNARGNAQGNAQGYGQNNEPGGYRNTQNANKDSNTVLIVIIAIATSFIWVPLVISALGIIIGILGAVVGIIFGLGAAGVSMVCAGIALFVAGLLQISVPFIGLLLCGGGLIVLGLGMLFTLACGALCTKALPAMIRGIVNLCRLPFKNRSVMA